MPLMDEDARELLLARVGRKEYMARLCEKGKLAPDEYIEKVNELRAAEQLPPLAAADACCVPESPRRRRRKQTGRRNPAAPGRQPPNS